MFISEGLAGAVLAQQGVDLAPAQVEVGVVEGQEAVKRLADAVQGQGEVHASLLRDHALDEPVHLPQVGIGQHLAGGHTLLAVAVQQRPCVDLLALQDGVALGLDRLHLIGWHGGAEAGDIGAPALMGMKAP